MAHQPEEGVPELDDRGFMRAVLPSRPRTAEDVSAFVSAARRLSADKPVPVLLDARHVSAVRPSALETAERWVSSFEQAG